MRWCVEKWDVFGWTPSSETVIVIFWHQKYSLPCTKVLSFVACIIKSKIPVIGASNRSWDDVKTIKSGKIYSLSSDVSEKQSIIYTYAFI